MTFFFDTSVLIDFLHGDKKITQFIADHQGDTIVTSSVCVFELFSGVYGLKDENPRTKSHQAVSLLLESLSFIVEFDAVQAETAGMIWANLADTGKIIDDTDVLIAASALSIRATLVTRNIRHFSRVAGLTVLAV